MCRNDHRISISNIDFFEVEEAKQAKQAKSSQSERAALRQFIELNLISTEPNLYCPLSRLYIPDRVSDGSDLSRLLIKYVAQYNLCFTINWPLTWTKHWERPKLIVR